MVVVRYPVLPVPIRMPETFHANPDHTDYMTPDEYEEKKKSHAEKNDGLCMDCVNFGGLVLYDTICNPWTWITYCFFDSLDGQFCNNWCCTS